MFLFLYISLSLVKNSRKTCRILPHTSRVLLSAIATRVRLLESLIVMPPIVPQFRIGVQFQDHLIKNWKTYDPENDGLTSGEYAQAEKAFLEAPPLLGAVKPQESVTKGYYSSYSLLEGNPRTFTLQDVESDYFPTFASSMFAEMDNNLADLSFAAQQDRSAKGMNLLQKGLELSSAATESQISVSDRLLNFPQTQPLPGETPAQTYARAKARLEKLEGELKNGYAQAAKLREQANTLTDKGLYYMNTPEKAPGVPQMEAQRLALGGEIHNPDNQQYVMLDPLQEAVITAQRPDAPSVGPRFTTVVSQTPPRNPFAKPEKESRVVDTPSQSLPSVPVEPSPAVEGLPVEEEQCDPIGASGVSAIFEEAGLEISLPTSDVSAAVPDAPVWAGDDASPVGLDNILELSDAPEILLAEASPSEPTFNDTECPAVDTECSDDFFSIDEVIMDEDDTFLLDEVVADIA